MNNIYIQTLKLGFENPEGITLREIAKRLNIDIHKNSDFNLQYIIWFYENFYNYNYEIFVSEGIKKEGISYRITPGQYYELNNARTLKSYLKGDAVNKYIDYLELERTRESSKQASFFATGSIFIAIMALILPFLVSPDEIVAVSEINTYYFAINQHFLERKHFLYLTS